MRIVLGCLLFSGAISANLFLVNMNSEWRGCGEAFAATQRPRGVPDAILCGTLFVVAARLIKKVSGARAVRKTSFVPISAWTGAGIIENVAEMDWHTGKGG